MRLLVVLAPSGLEALLRGRPTVSSAAMNLFGNFAGQVAEDEPAAR